MMWVLSNMEQLLNVMELDAVIAAVRTGAVLICDRSDPVSDHNLVCQQQAL